MVRTLMSLKVLYTSANGLEQKDKQEEDRNELLEAADFKRIL